MKYFVTSIHTDSGKTLVSAILCKALNAGYWKPIQAGYPKDTDTVSFLLKDHVTTYPEAYVLATPASPHAASKIDNVTIELNKINLPVSDNIIVEGAGGCLVPLNNNDFVIDIAIKLNLPVIVVSNLYLGSINHTLLTIEALKNRKVELKGIIFNGERNEESEKIILHHTKLPCLLKLERETNITPEIIEKYASELRKKLR
jgi:dethiobiotin synthetase